MAHKSIRFLDVGWSYQQLKPQIDGAVQRVLDSGYFIGGPEVSAFEAAFAEACGTRHAIGTSNGLDALELILRAMAIGSGDEVIVPGHTFIATWLAVSAVGATPVPVDVQPETANLDPAKLEAAITANTRAVIAVHLYGQPADCTALQKLCAARQIKLIEDAAQAHLAQWQQRTVGGLGDAAAFSFYPGKNLGAFGDGGAITTNEDALAHKIRILGNYGAETKYEHVCKGRNARLDPLQAAILTEKLQLLPRWNQRRAEIARHYLDALDDLQRAERLSLPGVADPAQPVWHIYALRLREREKVQAALAEVGVETLIHYPHTPYQAPAYQELSCRRLPSSEDWCARELSLPMGPHLSDSDIEYTTSALRKILRR